MDRQKTEAWLKERNMHMITEDDDAAIAAIIRANLERYHLDIPGTAYFDPELDHLSSYYNSGTDERVYFILTDESGRVIGGAGIAEFPGIDDCAEGLYLETHSNLNVAMRMYEKYGFHLIGRPETVVHSTMDRFYMKEL